MSNKALVVIDIQNDITKNHKEIAGLINSAIDRAVGEGMHIVYIKHHNITAGTNYTAEEYRARLLEQFPHLKRWAQQAPDCLT